jgi:hypothetical protein
VREVVREETPRRQSGGKAHASREPGLGGESAKHRRSALAGTVPGVTTRGGGPVKCPEQMAWGIRSQLSASNVTAARVSPRLVPSHYNGYHRTRHGNTTIDFSINITQAYRCYSRYLQPAAVRTKPHISSATHDRTSLGVFEDGDES